MTRDELREAEKTSNWTAITVPDLMTNVTLAIEVRPEPAATEAALFADVYFRIFGHCHEAHRWRRKS